MSQIPPWIAQRIFKNHSIFIIHVKVFLWSQQIFLKLRAVNKTQIKSYYFWFEDSGVEFQEK